MAQIAPSVGRQFTPDEIKRLNAIGAFVKLSDTGVAHILLHSIFANEPVTTQHLHTDIGRFETQIG